MPIFHYKSMSSHNATFGFSSKKSFFIAYTMTHTIYYTLWYVCLKKRERKNERKKRNETKWNENAIDNNKCVFKSVCLRKLWKLSVLPVNSHGGRLVEILYGLVALLNKSACIVFLFVFSVFFFFYHNFSWTLCCWTRNLSALFLMTWYPTIHMQ